MNTSIYDDTHCYDCRKETNDLRTKTPEWYMVIDVVWNMAVPDYTVEPANFFCVGCIEKRIGRKLVKTDFVPCYLNDCPGYERSARLVNRMRSVGT